MYRLYCDGLPLYNDRLESLKILDPSVELEEKKQVPLCLACLPTIRITA